MTPRPCPEIGRYRLTQRQADTLDTLTALPPTEAGWTVAAVAAEVGVEWEAARKRLDLLVARSWVSRIGRNPARYALTARGLEVVTAGRAVWPGQVARVERRQAGASILVSPVVASAPQRASAGRRSRGQRVGARA